ncbi:RagB/SusD family nutrient uptake outer membrane protein [Chryseobacterium indologenes]|uniref:RagB/SusD family nutrient uptake outer membrane protein n=1 Tax=Chryseobacterium indologenes TaxID=253 RepID=UPI000B5197D5|nr:RagB/SusD family nutrient uptake outer membrane protein [Chryseobacterium indologenes]ASE62030.1 RagB/SusD family nutrient uptake outer membrane protein [Chryseobacterium indologenes]
MKSIKFSAVLTILLLHIATSCEKLIEVDLPQNQIVSDQVFADVQTANSALAGLYAGLWDNSPLSGDKTGTLMSLYTDDLDYFAPASNTGELEIFQNVQIDNNVAILSYWTAAYQKIYQANAIIEGTEKSSGISANEKQRIIGEALLVRSVIYIYLVQIFGDIPYCDSTDYQINKTISKTSVKDVLDRLAVDLNKSIGALVDEYRNPERIFPNRKVAQLLLAQVYMLQNKWNASEVILRDIIKSATYQFQSDITKVFKKGGLHILWQLKPKNNGDATKESISYYFSNSAPLSFALSSNLVNSFSQSDLRKQKWMTSVTFNGTTWYRADKYKNRTNNTDEYSIIFRLEEVYLMLAEALVKQNKTNEALPYLNATRQRANLSPINLPITNENLLNEILQEYRKEYFTEAGHRFFDLKRFEKLDDLVTVKPNWKTFHSRWPLPQNELLLNSNLKPQNSGY